MAKKHSQEKPASVTEIGQEFLEYYANQGYEIIPGSSLLNDSVPMSFVMSAGMVQFENMAGKKRNGDHFALIQNCFRYFDLEKIGVSNTHLSLFQMSGAFDFGPIDQQRTISQIWDLLINVYGFDANSLAITYFGGDTIDGQILPADNETASAWRSVGIPDERIFGLPAKNNFWSQTAHVVGHMNSRKRGPNTEVFWDNGVEFACTPDCIPGCNCGRYIEFLNTLFITYTIGEENEHIRQLIPLKEPFTEIVIGLERAAMILQEKKSVFEIDSMNTLVQQLYCFSKPLPVEIEGLSTQKFERLMVDHIRALLFLTADGAPPPGKGGRSRLMRILMRELLTSQRLLGISDPGFMRSMILTALEIYPKISKAKNVLMEFLTRETQIFDRTVQVGMYDLDAILKQNGQQMSGADVLALEKKHGLPLPWLRYQLWQRRIEFQHEEYLTARKQLFENEEAINHGSKLENHPRWHKTDEIIQIFLKEYKQLGYQLIAGGSLIDNSIPMSFVMSAGLAQVEHGMIETEARDKDSFILLQNCFRHFDLNKIGWSSIHLSFFRMLGAFNFGVINRQKQIEQAWRLATKIYQLPPENLWVTYFAGDNVAGNKLSPDQQTCQIWQSLGIAPGHLLGLGAESNFWKQSAMVMGTKHASKCGPNSEIFFDRGIERSCGQNCKPGCGCGRFVEFLNMLFITGSMNPKTNQIFPTENPFTETVIGVERLAMILQGTTTIYEIESIEPIVQKIQQSANTAYTEEQDLKLQEYVLTDHLRALLFLTADGAPPPSKGGRAFIVRRLVREILISLALLGIESSSFLPVMMEQMLILHPSTIPKDEPFQALFIHYIESEKSKFERTLKAGFNKIERLLRRENILWVSGYDMAYFEKEYGLPLSMLTRFLDEKKITYNLKAYQIARELYSMK